MATPLLSPTVPDEILVQIVTALDPNNDRQCLVHLMATSSTLWEIAARHLYRSLSVDNKQLEQFVKAGRNLSSRLPRALTFVHRMRITPQLNKTTIHRLWDAAAGASDALFPNVRQLLYVDGLDGVTSYNTFRELRDMHLQHKLPGADTFSSSSYRSAPYARLHATAAGPRASPTGEFPPSWQVSFRIFDNYFHLQKLEDWFERQRWQLQAVRKLAWKGPELQPKVEVCLLSDKPVPPILERMETMNEFYDWKPSTSGFQFKVYPRQEPHGDCHPCDLCGHLWLSKTCGSWKPLSKDNP